MSGYHETRPCGGGWTDLVSLESLTDSTYPSVGGGMKERQLGAGQCNYQSSHFENFENYYHYDFIISNIPTGPRVISPNCTMN